VLSPFFDPDVGAVLRLQAASAAGKVQYGLVRTEEGLIAPFLGDIAGKDRPSLFVVPPNEGRPLHAKWFELTGRDGGALVMTGSVNATRQSLWTTNNIEVSLVRRLPSTSIGNWKVASETPEYRACAFPAPLAGPGDIGFVASISRANVLDVQFSHALPAPAVELILHQGEHRLLALRAETDRNQRLAVVVEGKLIQSLRDAALWLTVTGEGFEATNWVNIEPHLSVKPARVDLFKSAARIEDDSYDEEDMHLLFDAAHVLITGRKLTRKGKAGSKVLEDGGAEDGDRAMSESEWLAAQGSGTRSGDRPGAEALRIFAAVGKLLALSDSEVEQILGNGARPDASADDEDDADDGSDEGGNQAQVSKEDRKRERQRLAMKKTVPQARSTLQAAVDKRLRQAMPDALAMLIVPIKIRNHLRDGMPQALGRVDEGKEILSSPLPPHISSSLTGLLSTLAGMSLGPCRRGRALAHGGQQRRPDCCLHGTPHAGGRLRSDSFMGGEVRPPRAGRGGLRADAEGRVARRQIAQDAALRYRRPATPNQPDCAGRTPGAAHRRYHCPGAGRSETQGDGRTPVGPFDHRFLAQSCREQVETVFGGHCRYARRPCRVPAMLRPAQLG
jgi:hypothetical protein